MKILFKNRTILSKENYLKLLEFHQKKNNWKYWLYTAILFLLFIVAIAFQISNRNYLLIFLLSTFLVVFLSYRFFYPYYKTGKELKSDKVQHNLENYYFFYEKYFKVKNKFGNDKIKYYKLYKVYENENFFYLYMDKTNAFIIDKSGFSVGTIQDFKKFMKSKVWLKFKKN